MNAPVDVLAVMDAEIADMAGISCIGDEHEAAQRAREASMRHARAAVAELIEAAKQIEQTVYLWRLTGEMPNLAYLGGAQDAIRAALARVSPLNKDLP